MPYKSAAQRRWMYATHPKMAARWSRHTPKGKKLPQHVHREELETETPHFDSHVRLKGRDVDAIDLRMELYPMPSEQKRELMHAVEKSGAVGFSPEDDELLLFKPDHTVELIAQDAAKTYPRLPQFWTKYVQTEAFLRPSLLEFFDITTERD